MRTLLIILTALSLVACNPNSHTQPEPDEEINNEINNEEDKTYQIGDLYNCDGVRGLVFKVDESGKSGLIVSFYEPETMLAWGQEFTTTGANSRSGGEQNTAIIYSLPNCQTKYPAFAWCQSLGSGWYIPAIDELLELFRVSYTQEFSEAIATYNATPFTAGKYYLSSTEMDEWFIYLAEPSSATESSNYKQYTYFVRAIHSF